MREPIYITLFFFAGLGLLLMLSFNRASATSSTQFGPPNTTKAQAVECFGNVDVNLTGTWPKGLDCSDNMQTVQCQDSSHPNGGIVIGYAYNCSGGDWQSPCTSSCNAICSTGLSPQSNCQWATPPT